CYVKASTRKARGGRPGRTTGGLPCVISTIEDVRTIAESDVVESNVGSCDRAQPSRRAVKHDGAPVRHAKRLEDLSKGIRLHQLHRQSAVAAIAREDGMKIKLSRAWYVT